MAGERCWSTGEQSWIFYLSMGHIGCPCICDWWALVLANLNWLHLLFSVILVYNFSFGVSWRAFQLKLITSLSSKVAQQLPLAAAAAPPLSVSPVGHWFPTARTKIINCTFYIVCENIKDHVLMTTRYWPWRQPFYIIEYLKLIEKKGFFEKIFSTDFTFIF